MSPLSRSAVGVTLGLTLALARCADAPTQPSGPFTLTILPAFGNSSSRYYNGVRYESYAYDVDPAGQVFGMAERAEPRGFYGAALWPQDRKPVSLEVDGMVLTVAWGVNAVGQAVGAGYCGGRGNACIWEPGRLRNLGWFDYPGLSEPYAINDRGVAVGWAQAPPTGFDHAVLWRDGVA